MKDEITDVQIGFRSEYSSPSEEFVIRPYVVDEKSFMNGKTLREMSLRNMGCMVICFLRDNELHTNPSPDEPILQDDLVWIAGQESSVGKLE
jgi:uncharacterized protein with PhoU and TrkA domain